MKVRSRRRRQQRDETERDRDAVCGIRFISEFSAEQSYKYLSVRGWIAIGAHRSVHLSPLSMPMPCTRTSCSASVLMTLLFLLLTQCMQKVSCTAARSILFVPLYVYSTRQASPTVFVAAVTARPGKTRQRPNDREEQRQENGLCELPMSRARLTCQ
jgi:hypothetical protein